jgi:hypothetical protein
MSKQEKIVSLTKYVEAVNRILSGKGLPAAKRLFFERDLKRTQVAIERLR